MESLAFAIFTTIDQASWSFFLLGILAVLGGAIAQATTGVGLGMIAAPVLMLIDRTYVPGPLLLLALLISLLIVIREWRFIDFSGLSVIVIGRLMGTVFAGLSIALIPLAVYEFIFGLLILGSVFISTTGWRVSASKRNLVVAGVTSGYMGTLTSIGAPPVALAYQHHAGPVLRSTMAAFLAIGAALSIMALVAVDQFSSLHIAASVIFLPPLLFGFWISNWIILRLKRRHIRNAVLTFSAISSIILVLKSLVLSGV